MIKYIAVFTLSIMAAGFVFVYLNNLNNFFKRKEKTDGTSTSEHDAAEQD